LYDNLVMTIITVIVNQYHLYWYCSLIAEYITHLTVLTDYTSVVAIVITYISNVTIIAEYITHLTVLTDYTSIVAIVI